MKAKQTEGCLIRSQEAEQRAEADFRSVAAVVAKGCVAAGKLAKPRKVVPTLGELGEAWKAQRSRRHIARTIARVFRMAVYPCRHIQASPLPMGFLPRATSRKALTYLYPENDNALLACPSCPERPELFVTTASRQQIRVHDLRGTFVTLALANGRPESWVMARTGHRSSQMVNRYRGIATSFAELNLGELGPLERAIPELAQLALLGQGGPRPGPAGLV